MMELILDVPRWLLRLIDTITMLPIYVLFFLFGNAGRAYGVGVEAKAQLLIAFWRNARRPHCTSMAREHIALADAILRISPNVKGNVAEFGCYKGMSAASLSLVCRLVGRQLYIFDSFVGLPSPQTSVTNMVSGQTIPYCAGDYRGTLEEVQQNIIAGGAPEVCHFIPGYFETTLRLQALDTQYVMVFEDVDLPESVCQVLAYAWPRLVEGGYFVSHEARDLEIARIFFDRNWWHLTFNEEPPGLVGVGLGLPLGLRGSYSAYTVKRAQVI